MKKLIIAILFLAASVFAQAQIKGYTVRGTISVTADSLLVFNGDTLKGTTQIALTDTLVVTADYLAAQLAASGMDSLYFNPNSGYISAYNNGAFIDSASIDDRYLLLSAFGDSLSVHFLTELDSTGFTLGASQVTDFQSSVEAYSINEETLFIGDSANIVHWGDTVSDIATKYDIDTIARFSGDYGDLDNIPATFAPAVHGNEAHTDTYISVELDGDPTNELQDLTPYVQYTDSGTVFPTVYQLDTAKANIRGEIPDTSGLWHLNRSVLDLIESAYLDADSIKLAGIEAGATGDQTGSEIEGLLDTELANTDWKKAIGIVAGTVAAGDDSRFHDSVTVSGEDYAAIAGNQNIVFSEVDTSNINTANFISLIEANSGSASNTENVTQTAHGLSVGDWIKHDGVSYSLAQADAAANAGVIGVVSDSVDADNFTYQFAGVYSGGTWTLGANYFLSVDNAGVAETGITYVSGNIRVFVGTGVAGGLLLEIDVGTEIAAVNPSVDSLIAGDLVDLNQGSGDVTVSVDLSELVGDETAALTDSIPWIDASTGQKKMLLSTLKTLVADGTGTDDQTAAEVSIADAGGIITATDVEGALQENRTAINLNTAKVTNATHTGDATGATALTVVALNGTNLAALGTGLIKNTTSTGIPSIVTDNSSNWNTAYTDRLKWDGGATDLVAATGRTSLGATTVGGNLFTLTNPSAITFLRVNADNTVTAQSAADFKTSLSLNSVENTAISTWAGSANITTLGTVTSGTIGASSVLGGVTMTLGSDADGDIYYRSSNVLTRLAKGTATQVLTMNAGATAPAWSTVSQDNHTTQTLTVGTDTLDWVSGADGYINELSGNATVKVHNVPDGKSGTILVIRDATNTETFTVNVYSDAGSTELTQKIIGANNAITGTASKSSTITYKRFGTNVTLVYGHEYE